MWSGSDAVERFGDLMARLAWVRARQHESLPILIHRRRIYVLPTGYGLFMAALLLTMLVGALNYNNNPALLLGFLLAAAAQNSLVRAHLQLSGLRLKAVLAEPVHAGQTLRLRLIFDAVSARARPGMELRCTGVEALFALRDREETEAMLELPSERRGWFRTPRLRVSTIQPLGFARAWSWLYPEVKVLVYPALEEQAPPLPEAAEDGESNRTRMHGEQPHHLRDYRHGDAPRQIAWKPSARADRLLVREYESSATRDLQLDWFRLPALAYEARIRRLARWVVDAERRGLRYRLLIPGQSIGPARGPEHRHACLRALALMPPHMDVREQPNG